VPDRAAIEEKNQAGKHGKRDSRCPVLSEKWHRCWICSGHGLYPRIKVPAKYHCAYPHAHLICRKSAPRLPGQPTPWDLMNISRH